MKVYRVRGIKMKMITKEWIRDYVKDNFKGLIKYKAIQKVVLILKIE